MLCRTRPKRSALTREIIHAKPDDPRPAFVYDDAVAHHAVDPELPIPADKLDWMQQQLVKSGKLKEAIPLDQDRRAGVSREGAEAGA